MSNNTKNVEQFMYFFILCGTQHGESHFPSRTHTQIKIYIIINFLLTYILCTTNEQSLTIDIFLQIYRFDIIKYIYKHNIIYSYNIFLS